MDHFAGDDMVCTQVVCTQAGVSRLALDIADSR